MINYAKQIKILLNVTNFEIDFSNFVKLILNQFSNFTKIPKLVKKFVTLIEEGQIKKFTGHKV